MLLASSTEPPASTLTAPQLFWSVTPPPVRPAALRASTKPTETLLPADAALNRTLPAFVWIVASSPALAKSVSAPKVACTSMVFPTAKVVMSPATPNFTSPAEATKLMLPVALLTAALTSKPPLAVINKLPDTLTAWVLESTSVFLVPARKFMLPC